MNKELTNLFPIGMKNNEYSKYFSGTSYIYPISLNQVSMFNVTFEPGCRNNWHIHQAKSSGGQILIVLSGKGWYQQEGEKPRLLKAGDVVNIPANVKHWHGATKDSWFQHIAIEVPGEENKAIWCEAVDDIYYNELEEEK